MKKRKILIATPNEGGPITYSKLLARELPGRGFDIRIVNFGSVLFLPKGLRHLLYLLKIIFRGFSVDVIYAQDPVSTGLPALIGAKILFKKFILKIVGDYAWEQGSQRAGVTDLLDNFSEEFEKYPFMVKMFKRVQLFVANKADRIVVPSGYLKKIVTNWGVDPEKITVIYNAFDEPKVEGSKEEIRGKLGWKNPTILYAGRLVPWKGIDTVISILPEILKENPDVSFCIVGEGPDKSYLQDIAAKNKVEKHVLFTGKMSHEDTLQRMKAADIFVLNTSYEGFSHVILEALAVGVPIATTPVGGNTEIIENGKNGVLFPYNDREKLGDSILELLNNPQKIEAITNEGKKDLSRFNESTMLSKISEVLGS